MKKIIWLLLFPLMGMPAFAQQKKKPAPPKKQPAAVTPAKNKKVVQETPPPEAPPYAIDPMMPYPAPARASHDTSAVFTSVEEMAEFPGGMSAMMRYISNNIRYPDEAKEADVQGRVIVRFVVDRSGEIRNAVIMRDIGAGCGKEALRVVNGMPKWKPGKMHGQPVHVYFTLPVQFKLQDPDPVPADTIKQ